MRELAEANARAASATAEAAQKQLRIDELRMDAKMKQAAFFALANVPVEAVQAFLG